MLFRSYVPDKNKAWKDLIYLAKNEDGFIRMYSYHSLGRASILKATESENDLYKLLNTDISVSEEDFIKILNSLEYSFKKKLKEGTINNDTFKNIQNKLPKDFVGVKYSRAPSGCVHGT